MWFLIGQATNCDNEVGSSIFGGKLELSIYGPLPTQSLINDQVLQKPTFVFLKEKSTYYLTLILTLLLYY